jgi:hypothetical protein
MTQTIVHPKHEPGDASPATRRTFSPDLDEDQIQRRRLRVEVERQRESADREGGAPRATDSGQNHSELYVG